ncbi:MAG: exodeoxyribonuclease I [Tahibacter sp.]
MTEASYFWHDYETTGADPRRDRPSQFAGQRTNMDLQPIGDPVSFFCRPAPDVLPHPEAVLITGITPQQMLREGLSEADFAARIHEELATPGTCGVGYNSLRFDDEVTRHLLYRNLYEPYSREWEHGNSRWDLIDLARLCFALRPDGIEWPRRDDGSASFRLGDLAGANGLLHERAHDASSDVQVTIELARLLRSKQPRLFDYHFALRRKQRAFELLDVARRAPVLHVSSRYPATRGCLALVVPLAVHPTQSNAVIVYDLDVDPTPLLELDADAIAARVFVARADLPEGVERIPLKLVHANRSPALAPVTALKGVDTARIGLSMERGLAHLERLRNATGLDAKLRQVFSRPMDDAPVDAELALYNGFIGDADKRLLREVHRTPAEQLTARTFAFRDARLVELLFRYRARNWPHTLSTDEAVRWQQFCQRRVHSPDDSRYLSVEQYFATIAQIRSSPETPSAQMALLDALQQWGEQTLAPRPSGGTRA